jgi:hypothetical protein
MFEASITIVLMMEAANTAETSVNFYKTTRCNIPEDRHLQDEGKCIRRREIIQAFIFPYASTCRQ